MKHLNRIALVLSLVAIGIVPVAVASPVCSLKVKAPIGTRTFAKTSDLNDWQEFQSVYELPDLSLASGMSAQFWQHKHGTPSVITVEPEQGFQIDTRYCFDEGGQLEFVSFEIRTDLGWGHRTEGTVLDGVFSETSSEFFRVKDGKAMAQPEGVSETPQSLQPKLYLSLDELPFADLLPVQQKMASR